MGILEGLGLAGVAGRLTAIGGAILGFLALLLGSFLKGKSSARKEAELDTLRATRDAQVKVGEAVGKDDQIDAEATRKAQEAREGGGEGGRQEDGTYRL